ncbi:DUF1992 domain-containing protein [Pseudonocardia sp. CA-107938]|uniref:DnaJ family domain-containing protein n=1 Tax=Pseudonocardia sp. CA-107938 TaxID=3240021 RepID=UPI003D9012F0
MTSEHGFESAIDRQIRLAQERGAFDDLPGKGKPLPGLDRPYDEDWWVRGWLEREGVTAEALLPTSILLRREVERLPQTVRRLRSEVEVRDVVGQLNRRIADHIRFPSGPRVPVAPVKVDEVLTRWRAQRAADQPDTGPSPATAPPARAWWRRFRRG